MLWILCVHVFGIHLPHLGIVFAVTCRTDIVHFLRTAKPSSALWHVLHHPSWSQSPSFLGKSQGIVAGGFCVAAVVCTAAWARQHAWKSVCQAAFGFFFFKDNVILFQRRRCIQLHIHPGRQRHLSDIGAEHRGRGHRPRRRLCSRRLLGQMVLLFLCSSLTKRGINSLFPLSSILQWRATSPPPFPPANMRQSLHRIGPNLALDLHLPALLDPFLPLLSPTPKKTELFCQWTNEEKTPLPRRRLWRSRDWTWKVKKEGWP